LLLENREAEIRALELKVIQVHPVSTDQQKIANVLNRATKNAPYKLGVPIDANANLMGNRDRQSPTDCNFG
jgi:hypothetical protein